MQVGPQFVFGNPGRLLDGKDILVRHALPLLDVATVNAEMAGHRGLAAEHLKGASEGLLNRSGAWLPHR